jgi:hypothetical protein
LRHDLFPEEGTTFTRRVEIISFRTEGTATTSGEVAPIGVWRVGGMVSEAVEDPEVELEAKEVSGVIPKNGAVLMNPSHHEYPTLSCHGF